MKNLMLFQAFMLFFVGSHLTLFSQGAGEIEPNNNLTGNNNPIIIANGSYSGSVPWDSLNFFCDVDIWKICPGSSGLLSAFLLILPDGSQVSGGLYESDSPDDLGSFLGASGDFQLISDKYYYLYTVGGIPILPGAYNTYSWQLSGDAFGPLHCLPEGITFTTQEQIDSFQANYPGCIIIEGDVEISGSDITNLNGLSVLTAIGGDFGIYGCDVLINLTGLDNVTSIGGNLWIQQNYALSSIAGLANVTSIGESLGIAGTDALTSLTGLDNLTSIGGSIWIVDNAALINLTGLENITSINGYLTIGEYLYGSNPSLTSLSGLDNVTSIGGSLKIDETVVLSNLTGLNNVTSIGGHLEIYSNNGLSSFTGLDNLTSIGGGFKIGYIPNPYGGNQSLTSLTGLENLTSIGGVFEVYNNDALVNFSGLNNLTSIDGPLTIDGNESLTSLTGLENIDPTSIGNLQITYNPSLSTCEVQSICNYIADPMGLISINNNAVGCTNLNQVQQACLNISVTEINSEPAISIHPNPTEKELFISGQNGATINEVNIYTQTGQRVLHEKRLTGSIDVSMLRQGMFIIEVVTNESKIWEKLIVK